MNQSQSSRPRFFLASTPVVLALALTACGSGNAPTPDGTPSADALSTKVLAQPALEVFTQAVMPELQTAIGRYASGKGFDQVGGPPLLGLLGGGVGGLSLAQTKQLQAQQFRVQSINVVGSDCTTHPGNQTDADQDGILDASTATYSCAGTAGFAYSYNGSWTMNDKSQNDGGAAYLFTGKTAGTYSVQDGLVKYTWVYAEKSSLDTLATSGGGSSGTYLYNWDAQGSAGVLNVAATFDLKWRLNLTLSRTPDASGQTVTLSGRASAGNTQSGLGGYTDIQGTLHASPACTTFDGGTLKFTSGGSSKTVTYTGCGVTQ
ncbi:hypothetical protein MF271_13150 [Deinococcus sp. KNUC1210]|uniref:hypothetical protein n=1 Tax=Deinococcus sp. KNUC1210 TaxID=2917691 RepID=UPI001EEFE7CF|nr:hypothetical protein [Deinococcus sp. KNUC1210]ULH14913.1 hypothetical protein MF271_13150 [Deinococcus sp. KNUC1210]